MTKAFGPTVVLLAFALCVSGQSPKKEVKGTPQKGPCDAAMTQLDLSQCYGEQLSRADAHLNKVYASLLKQMQSQKSETAMQKLKTVEKAWLHYRDLHCEAARDEYEGGSMSPMVWAQCMAMATEHRIDEIKAAYENGDTKLE